MEKDEQQISAMIDRLVENAKLAQEEFLKLSQEQVDHIVKMMAMAGLDKHMELAKLAVEETQKGVYEDKITKNIFATEEVYHSIKYEKTVGVVNENPEEDFMEVAEPIGPVAAVIPVTNPTSTTMFKALICIKTRNPVIFSFHPGAQRCSSEAAKIMLQAAIEAGAPQHCIGWIEQPSIQATQKLMAHPGVALILATGGAKLVCSAYSSGKPALGVGPGNVPCYIEKTAHIRRAVTDLIMSKTFDNGLICASEQAVIIDREIADDTIQRMKENGCYFLNPAEVEQLTKLATHGDCCHIRPEIVGKSAVTIAEMAGLAVPPDTKILVAPLEGVGPDYPLSQEKLSPILALYVVENSDEGIRRCEEMVEFAGLGHSAVIHSENQQVIEQFSRRIRTGRIIVNSPSTHGAIGDLYNTNVPSLTLGCGSMGRNSTTSNVSVHNLINIKRVAMRKEKLQWFRVPERIYFMPGSVQYLSKMPGVERVLIVTDKVMADLGYVDKVIYHLRKRQNDVHIEVFDGVEPDPPMEVVAQGVERMKRFLPDTLIALGGGSAIDCAKGMWLFFEYPDVEFEHLRLKFLDIRKRTYKYPKLGRRVQLVAIPTTSGSGSEVTAFTVISDKGKQIKYPLADYELTPDVAIIDSDFVMSIPPKVTADTGLDVLSHAIEAYVSVMASDYTDGLALKAIELVFRYLPRAYKNGRDKEARFKMHNASAIAGIAFTNAFLGINHSLAHKLGGQFGIPHGRANALLLPHVIEYNATLPSKFVSFPNYTFYVAPEKYRQIAKHLGLPCSTEQEGVRSLISAIQDLMKELEVPQSIAECGVERSQFEGVVHELSEKAFEDQCTTSNPRMPLISELEEIYRKAYVRG
ncbi:bifunctional acetaldehyde-CoA/alcohol dehydrogenase [Desulforamulus ruminis]|uniref:Aldehyde-alcohol dehydrogenase n=1 Tax=Desulforamulus ruminis (strain ATCC 23193 / DSM 2154 / NCIMB 8452 / DL) TaxID=696281 RepID=F6DST5_DESRL|nr:bifunctional acetaldehyde-CoA/alcohol dehydrogenase [Desulforamulus ruminis]AEG58904.1 iron-containing alcohol dehydrogenase [Desulforamulus ruminis DSM 2154]